jgi:hypothetical protein
MKRLFAAILALITAAPAVTPPADTPTPKQGTALTIYNQDFGVVRQAFTLDLQSGVTQVRFGQATSHVEPQSVILRDLANKTSFRILEQDYRNDPISQELLLSMYEGRTIDFLLNPGAPEPIIVKGKIIRSGYVPPNTAYNGQNYGSGQPIIEVNGQMRFGLPGLPLFPDLGDDTILKPTLNWLIQSEQPAQVNAEVSYVSGGLNWAADYNLVAPENGDTIDFIGWISFANHSGRNFEDARIKLIAGDVNKIAPNKMRSDAMRVTEAMDMAQSAPVVQEKAFDEYHMYTLQRPVTLHDNEMKQVEFLRGTGVHSQRIYVYDGAEIPYGYNYDVRGDVNYGTQSNKKIWVMQEFKNTKENGLGIPLPKGRLRFYRRDDDGRLEFIGENEIDHTPADETVRVYTGNTFDVVGERKRTTFHVDSSRDYFDESFEVRVRNHKKEPITVRVVEHLYRWTNWQITDANHKYNKKDAQTIEFPVTIAANGEAIVNYSVHYSW